MSLFLALRISGREARMPNLFLQTKNSKSRKYGNSRKVQSYHAHARAESARFQLSEKFHDGFVSSLAKINAKISVHSTPEDIKKVCEIRREEIYKRIDNRTNGSPMERKDEMTTYEKGAIRGAEAVMELVSK